MNLLTKLAYNPITKAIQAILPGGVSIALQNALGRTDGQAVPAGYVGQFFTQNQTSKVLAGASGAFKTIDTVSLPAGNWLISVTYYLDTSGMTSPNNILIYFSTSTNSDAGTTLPETASFIVSDNTSGIAVGSLTFIKSITTNTPFFLVGRATYGGTNTQGWVTSLKAIRLP